MVVECPQPVRGYGASPFADWGRLSLGIGRSGISKMKEPGDAPPDPEACES